MRIDPRPAGCPCVARAGSIVAWGFLLTLAFAAALFAPASRAQIPDLEWADPEIVDQGVPDVSSTSGASAAHTPAWLSWGQGEWHVVYAKDGHIYHRVRTATEWLPVERLTADGAIARDPHLAFGGGYLHVVWEDARTGHPEVRTRRWNGASWSADECLTCDATASSQPVIAGGYSGAIVAWQESTGSGGAIRGSEWNGSSWGLTQAISQSPAAATEPTVTAEMEMLGTYNVAWTDTRHGAPEIYLRTGYVDYDWEPEIRLTDLPGGCRHPSIDSEACCGDAIATQAFVLFEYDGSGTVETYEACYNYFQGTYVQQLSPGDGIPSLAPSACGFTLEAESCALMGGGVGSQYFGCWTDSLGPHVGNCTVRAFEMCYPQPESDLIPATGYAKAALACVEGDPLAGLMALWIEDRVGVPTLMAQRGSTTGCYREEFTPKSVILLAPEGIPADSVRLFETCGGDPVPQRPAGLSFSSALDAALTWDPEQPHPDLPVAYTGSDGNAIFSIRGGGCSQTGWVYAWCAPPDPGMYTVLVHGAKSPDVDGDCLVGGDDFAYVESMIGTNDFCADLDGSGIVDAADLAIVRSTLGDHCSDLPSGVEEPDQPVARVGEERTPPIVTLLSNPCHDAAVVRCDLRAATRVGISVIDPAGSLVRDLGVRDLPAGPSTLVWDTRDAGGRRVTSGIYFLALRGVQWDVRRSVLVVR